MGIITLRLSEQQINDLDRMANEKLMSRSDYIRSVLFSQKHTNDSYKRKIAEELAMLCNHINSLDRKEMDNLWYEVDGLEKGVKNLLSIL